MSTILANAAPKKRLFIDIFTRDISLEDCILDLIDNSIDSLLRWKKIQIHEDIFEQNAKKHFDDSTLPIVSVELSEDYIEINDRCGGIPISKAVNEVFVFGKDIGTESGGLGVYGIGLKRAIFKIGKDLEMSSFSDAEAFEVNLDLESWAEKDEKPEDWRIPINVAQFDDDKKNTTSIKISRLNEDIKMRINDGTFFSSLSDQISKTYSFIINRYVEIKIQGEFIKPFEVPFGTSDEVTPAFEEFEHDGVFVRLLSALIPEKMEPSYRKAGWYILCNGRVVETANKDQISGWGAGLPIFQNKFNSFIGYAFFQSENPLRLPWKTTKKGVNRESQIFIKARAKMIYLSIPITRFLSKRYSGDLKEEPFEREIAQRIENVNISDIFSDIKKSDFIVSARKEKKPNPYANISYKVLKTKLDLVKKSFRRASMSNKEVGERTFNYYIDMEGLD